MTTDLERRIREIEKTQLRMLVGLIVALILIVLLWASLAGASCNCLFLNGRSTQVCSSSYDSPVSCGPGEQDLRDQLEHNRREWRKLMAIHPGDEDFTERMGDYLDED